MKAFMNSPTGRWLLAIVLGTTVAFSSVKADDHIPHGAIAIAKEHTVGTIYTELEAFWAQAESPGNV